MRFNPIFTGMDEIKDKSLCLQFYNYLCEKIGTEELFRLRQKYYLLFDFLLKCRNEIVINSGSKSEGLELEGSDIDVMFLDREITVFENEAHCRNKKPNVFIMYTQDIKPGFTILKLSKSSFISNESKTFHYLDIWGKDIVLSNVRVKQFLKSKNKDFDFVHGPCITNKDYTRDYAFCFRCPTWIGQARKLRGKSRLWPCPSVVENIERKYGIERVAYVIVLAVLRTRSIAGNSNKITGVDLSLNKVFYEFHKRRLPCLILGLNTDAAAGWLYLATYLFFLQHFSVSLRIVDYALSKCTPDKLYSFDDDLHYEQLDYTEQQALKYGCLDISSIYRRRVIEAINFREHSILPFDKIDELKNRHIFTNSPLPPVVYAHYLRFLCFHRLYDGENCRKSLEDIQLTIENDYFVCKPQKERSYKLLAIASFKIGDRNVAKKCLAVADRHILKS
ncbi:unnamed protein product [Mytilus coruscus]|uniref:Uncharacterized protein n=1 Tax=Mytilus coruscus TaxID=42192 RepID=A0A6J8BWN1_MYTCO|nr:unnamed protein product [Mytilus coruscus]